MMNLNKFVTMTIPVLEDEMKGLIESSLDEDSNILKDIFIYHLGLNDTKEARGKRLRPLLVLLITFSAGLDWKNSLPAAVAIEFLHNFSLIHDDVEDQSDMRHGRPTIWSKWGSAQAINAGDGMYTLVFQAIHGLNKNNSAEVTLAASDLITQACMKLVEGQINDVAFEGREEITIDEYWKMIDGKTAALIACSTQLGGLIAGLGQKQQEILYSFGLKLGRGFQIQDDFLGMWGKPETTGKPSDSDLVNHKQTLPVIYGLQMSSRFKERWSQGKIQKTEIQLLSDWLKQDGVYSRVQSEAENINIEIDQHLVDLNLSDSEGLSMLKELFSGLRQRNH
jgi:geranylgeranyl diphosphate synthase, type I